MRKSGGVPVERGRLEQIGGVSALSLSKNGKWTDKNRVSLQEFRKVLQCPPTEPALHANGILSMIKHVQPLRRDAIETMCAYAENTKKCKDGWGRFPWIESAKFAKQLRAGTVPERDRDLDENVRLIRVMGGRLYFDWPWKPKKKFNYESTW